MWLLPSGGPGHRWGARTALARHPPFPGAISDRIEPRRLSRCGCYGDVADPAQPQGRFLTCGGGMGSRKSARAVVTTVPASHAPTAAPWGLGKSPPKACAGSRSRHFCFWAVSKNGERGSVNVRFAAISGLKSDVARCPRCAIRRHLVGKLDVQVVACEKCEPLGPLLCASAICPMRPIRRRHARRTSIQRRWRARHLT
jgi:hypothetical protein